MKIFLIIPILLIFSTSQVFGAVPEQYSSSGDYEYCGPRTACGLSIDTVAGKPITIDITVKSGIPANVRIGSFIDGPKGFEIFESKVFTGSFHGSYIATSDKGDVTISSASKDGSGIDYKISWTSYDYPVQKSGGCLIATATYGSELAPQVQQLRELRDNQLLNTESGTAFMNTFNDIYYSFSPVIADYERENPLFKEAVKIAITPMISSLSLMENANSESEVISLGLSVIALNIGMYLGVPAIVIIGIRKI